MDKKKCKECWRTVKSDFETLKRRMDAFEYASEEKDIKSAANELRKQAQTLHKHVYDLSYAASKIG